MQNKEPLEPIEYVIYCRKSTDETSEHQKQSIPDQIKACINYAEKEWLIIKKKPTDFSMFESELELHKEDAETDITNRRIYQQYRWLYIIKEQKTAKLPDKRKKWSFLMNLIKDKKIKGLISYSPDRQARNMLDWWALINYVDQELVDLKYTNFHFEPTASGKMMLGIWFVFSKQYSDNLSTVVSRWNKSAIEAWKAIWKHKPWYMIKNGRHIPHPEYFSIIQEAFMMKIDGLETDKVIANFINSSGYRRTYKDPNKVSYILADNLWDLWRDEFYYGIYINGDNVTDLRETNLDYIPMISEEQHAILKSRHEWNTKSVKKTKHKDEYAEIAIFDNEFIKTQDWYGLSFSLPNPRRFKKKIENSKGKLKFTDVVWLHQIQYRCTYEASNWYNIGFTAEEVNDTIIDKLKEFHVSDEDFSEYLVWAKEQIRNIEKWAKEKRVKKNLDISRITREKNKYMEDNMSIRRDHEEDRIYQNKKKDFDKQLEILWRESLNIIEDERNEVLELEVFINLLNDMDNLYQEATYVQKWTLARLLFSNIVLDHQKRLTFAVKPWLESLFTGNGSDTETRTPVTGMRIPCPNP